MWRKRLGKRKGVRARLSGAVFIASLSAGLLLSCSYDGGAAGAAPVAFGDVLDLGHEQAPQADRLERMRDMLAQSGPDGQGARESAVARLLATPDEAAHQLLLDRLQINDDPDSLRLTILAGLRSQLLGSPSTQFGGAGPELRRQLLAGYVGACATMWANAPDVVDEASAPVRAAARRALRRVTARDLDAAASALMTSMEPAQRAVLLRCLADMQQALLARTIARHLEAPESVVREAAQKALDLLVYPDNTIRTQAEFDAWSQQYGAWTYVDLVQRSARLGPRAFQRL
ncbi:MAG: hypothetical protein VX044_07075, partial [Planctomycetota bacterium]|nr:hypothetical protein [Planctomycetota bacterium]